MFLARHRSATLVVAALIACCAGHASAQLLAYDGFGNGPRPDLAGSTGGSGWTTAWANVSTDLTRISGPGLTWPGLATTAGAAVTPTAGGVWPSSVYQRAFTAPPPGTTTLYVSFLLRDDAGYGIWGGLSTGQYPWKMSIGSPLGYYTYGFMLSEGLGDYSNKPLVPGETTLVVTKISLNAPAAGISYRMFLDPAVGSPEPGFPDAIMSVAQLGVLPAALSIDNGTGFTTDEIRVGLTWASVLPAGESGWTDLGHSKAGSAGRAALAGSGPLTPGSANQLALVHAAPSSTATLVFGLSAIDAPFKDGVMVPLPQLLLPLATNAAGAATLPFTWPAGAPAGTALYFQFWIQDPGATFGLAASNAVKGLSF